MWLAAFLFKLSSFLKLSSTYNPVATTNIQHRLYRLHQSIHPVHELNVYSKIRSVLPMVSHGYYWYVTVTTEFLSLSTSFLWRYSPCFLALICCSFKLCHRIFWYPYSLQIQGTTCSNLTLRMKIKTAHKTFSVSYKSSCSQESIHIKYWTFSTISV